ncbi:MAG: radical SAM protein [Clostridia bacterium]
MRELEACKLCPRECQVNRLKGQKGFCQITDKVEIALASLHYFEEPCISGKEGSGTIFFSHCNMKCMFCQNHEISQEGKGKAITVEKLAEIMVNQQKRGAQNINLVTPTMYSTQIKEAIRIAKEKGLRIPIIYNSNGYESITALKNLEGYIDIYLPDLKYYSNTLAEKYSKAPNYFEIATKAIREMIRQVGKPILDENGIMKKGVMIRHLVLPNHLLNTKGILKWIQENIKEDVWVSIMAQYFPTYQVREDKLLGRKLTKEEYDRVKEWIDEIGLVNGYMQELGEHEEEYVPNFDLSM